MFNTVEIVFGSPDTEELVRLINASYAIKEKIESYRRTPVYCPDLWILLKETSSDTVIVGGIADYKRRN